MDTHYREVAPIAMLRGEFVWFEWNRIEIETHGTIAKGSAAWVRRMGAARLRRRTLFQKGSR